MRLTGTAEPHLTNEERTRVKELIVFQHWNSPFGGSADKDDEGICLFADPTPSD
jgi:hypothetical protein